MEESGHVYGFDIQQQAIDNARRRLIRGGISKQVALIKGSHAFMLRQIDGDIKGKVSTVVFNLGYLLDVYIGANIADAMHFLADTLTHGMKHGDGHFRPVPGRGLRYRWRKFRRRGEPDLYDEDFGRQ